MVLLALVAMVAVASCSRVEYSLPGLDSFPAGEFEIVKRANADDTISIRVALFQRNLDILDTIFNKVSDPKDAAYMQYMTREEVRSLVSPSKIKQATVVAWAKKAGAKAESFGDWVRITASISTIEELLEAELHVVRDLVNNTEDIKIVSGTYTLPAHISEIVQFVQNLNQFHHLRRLANGRDGKRQPLKPVDQAANGSNDAVLPATLNALYNIDYTISESSTNCVAEFSAFAYLPSDLTDFSTGVDVQQPNTVTTVGTFNDAFADTECTLDIEYITAVSPNSNSYFWTTSGWILDLTQEILAYNNPPDVFSISWSSDERSDGQSYNNRCDSEIQQLGVMGISVLSASGDDGAVGTSNCNHNKYPLNPGYPCTSPYVTSVGATMLTGTPTKYTGPASACKQFTCALTGTEDPASENIEGYATGGGFSVYEPRPSYQDAAVSQYLNDTSIPKPPSSSYNAQNRGFPDVAANGLNYIIRDNGRWSLVGGTSAATPTWGAIFTIMNDHLAKSNKPTIGFANPLIYQMYADQSDIFLSIGNLSTNNEDGCGPELGYTSNPNGWDPVTGLGTPNVGNILSYLDSMMSTLPDRRN